MAYLTHEDLVKKYSFKYLGQNVLISDKCAIYEPEEISIGDFSRIDDFTVLSGSIEIGKFVHIAVFSNLAGGDQGIRIDDYSGIAYGCNLISKVDDYSGLTLSNPTVPEKYKLNISKPIIIGKHVKIGTNSIILPGVNIEIGCAISAASVVKESTKPFGLYKGNPAKRIRDLSDRLLQLEEEHEKFLQNFS